MNSVNLIGRLAKQVELKKTNSNKSVASITVAVNRVGKENEADFINCVVWNQSADFLYKYASKGDLISVSGSIGTRDYTNNSGQKVYITEVNANRVELLRKKSEEKNENSKEKNEFSKETNGFPENLNNGYMPQGEDYYQPELDTGLPNLDDSNFPFM